MIPWPFYAADQSVVQSPPIDDAPTEGTAEGTAEATAAAAACEANKTETTAAAKPADKGTAADALLTPADTSS